MLGQDNNLSHIKHIIIHNTEALELKKTSYRCPKKKKQRITKLEDLSASPVIPERDLLLFHNKEKQYEDKTFKSTDKGKGDQPYHEKISKDEHL